MKTIDPPHPSPRVAGEDRATARMLGLYIFGTNFAVASVEMMGSASLPLYLEKTFGNMSLMADFSIGIMFASIIGSQLSPLVVNRFSLKGSYLGLLGAAFLAAITIGGLTNFGSMTVPLLFALYILYRSLQAASLAAENVVIPSVLGHDQRAMEDLRGHKQSWNAVASTLTQNGAAAITIMLGTATHNLIIAPWFYIIGIAPMWLTLRIPRAADDARREAWKKSMGQSGGGFLAAVASTFRSYGRKIGHGYVVVMGDPALRISAMVSALITMFKWLTFLLLPQLFSKYVIGLKADASLAAPIMGVIVGLYSFGGLFAGKYVARHAEDLARAHGGDAGAIQEASRQALLQWIRYAGLSFLLVGSLALPLPGMGPLIHPASIAAAVAGWLHVDASLVPARLLLAGVLGIGTILAMWRPRLGLPVALVPVFLTFPLHVIISALAFFSFGIVQVIATLKNDSFLDAAVQEKLPSALADTRAFVNASSLFAGMLGLIGLKFVSYGKFPFHIPSPMPSFAGLPGLWPFVVIFTVLAIPSALAFYRAAGRLDALTRPRAAGKGPGVI